jgi:hypothetical protein
MDFLCSLGLSKDIIDKAVEEGKLRSTKGFFWGKPYRKLLRHEVINLVKELRVEVSVRPEKRSREIDAELEKLEATKKKLLKEKHNLENK